MYAKYFTVYFRRTIKFDARVANLILYYSNVVSIINIKLSTPIFGLPMV